MCPFHVQCNFRNPGRIWRGVIGAAVLVDFGERRVGQTQLQVELLQVIRDIGIIVRIHDGNRRSTAIPGHRPAVQGDAVNPIRMFNLGWQIAGRAGRGMGGDAEARGCRVQQGCGNRTHADGRENDTRFQNLNLCSASGIHSLASFQTSLRL